MYTLPQGMDTIEWIRRLKGKAGLLLKAHGENRDDALRQAEALLNAV